ncbi:2,3,4,5-tetrahydropyridine-2,6-dicarboxylate N-succinyltransferase [Candidatus Cyrtobacter comes]|uniref:2,3,4,5-tetrahydropyridine-2,6-dicarboxylate N-succinyltransferase n=1 Tax=Candidatus Cyrtobacter comes TaxID=675776 RepID=A0ABU5L6E4_9RICK|nr:2,3,4,5-tetrahydropyridine-2,6-dicarboxylate N-succinyltransferase [Candidatus Cyrtobacter comes]MDZ5761693.1 2,3,4,5-tetrahydropyridine-2,6-dicarboxylate N-succinyltransferase [Candidatus Cyrtobacter comes]
MEDLKTLINKILKKDSFLDNERQLIYDVIDKLDYGILSIVENKKGKWYVNDHLRKAILLYFKIRNNCIVVQSAQKFFDKIPLKFQNWSESDFTQKKLRVVPGAVVRYSAYLGENVVIMPSFINVGARIESGTMIDSGSTIGSCAYIGKNCHISSGSTIAGVLEPESAAPVIIEDEVFIGANSSISEGVRVCRGAVLASGVSISSSTKIYDRESNMILNEPVVPEFSVVVPGFINVEGPCVTQSAIIVKRVDEKTRSKTGINELLRYT